MNERPAWLRRIRADRERGATELARLAAQGLTASLERFSGNRPESLLPDLLHLAHEVRRSQPAMAPLFHLANAALLAAEAARTPREALLKVRSATRRFPAQQSALAAGACGQALRVIPAGAAVLTHSSSSLVEAVLRRAGGGGRGKRFSPRIRVICTESRPACEGRRLARRLSRSGIPTTLVIDAAAGEALEEADLFLVGADTVTPKGLIHKIGTKALAGLARKRGVPCYAVATSQKLLPERCLLPSWGDLREAGEIPPAAGPRLTVWNRLFDRTPWRDITAVVTEEGPLARADVSRRLRAMPIARGWG